MRSRTIVVVAAAVGVVLLAVGIIAVAHYHHPHSVCAAAHGAANACTKVKRRYDLGFLAAGLGVVSLVVAGVAHFRR